MKRDSYLRDLSSEHHQALGLVRDIIKGCQSGIPTPVLISSVRTAFQDELAPHFEMEEQAILPELERLGESALVEKTLEDHELMRQLIARLEEPGVLLEFSEALKSHVRFEERILFEACQKIFDEAAIAAIESKTLKQAQASTA